MENGILIFEYNMMLIERYIGETKIKLPKGKHIIEVKTKLNAGPGSPAVVTVIIDMKNAFSVELLRTVPPAITESESFDVGVDFGSPVSARYFDKTLFISTENSFCKNYYSLN
jgi:hypothetical protein